MAIRERMKALQSWGDRISQNIVRPLKTLVRQLLRSLFFISIARRQRNGGLAGFVLPTTILLLLVLSLAVGSISLRTLSRTQQVVGDRQQRVIDNAATPAIDRAKAKIAYLIERHEKNTPGIPPEDELVKMMLNREAGFADESVDASGNRFADIYTFDNANNPGIVDIEERIDIDNDGNDDNAWLFKSDTDGDDEPDAWIAYSIIFETPDPVPADPNDPNDTGQDTIDALRNVKADAIEERAKNLEVRNGPRSLIGSGERCPAVQQGSVEEGWFSDESNTVFLRKNFQINAIVIPGIFDENGNLSPNPNATVSTLELQQDRTFDVGNKWGAWFQSDLEVFPGRDFNWNGAMRTQGSLVVGKEKFNGYLISSKYSCFNIDKSASEVRVGENIITGQVDGGDAADAIFHVFTEFGTDPLGGNRNISLGNAGGSEVEGTADYTTVNDIGDVLLLDPVKTFLEGRAPTGNAAVDQDENPLRDNPDDFGSITLDETWNDASALADRITVSSARSDKPISYGDTYRHDRRPGPTPINEDSLDAVRNKQGEWEDLAHQEGMRVIVGQRLELGLPNGINNEFWGAGSCAEADNTIAGEPDRCHEARQRVTLKDKLAAVQATVMYRADVKSRPFRDDGEIPLACLATTVHPGTATTLARSATYHDFNTGDFSGALLDRSGNQYLAIEDFFSGRGTNGWEFEPPLPANQDQPLLDLALDNLANFAGDPKGGAPYFEAEQDDFVHPYPAMAMWGDFSILRRVLDREDADALADKTTQDTAKCLLGMLAHNISYLNDRSLDLSLVAASPNPINDILIELSDRLDRIATNNGLPGGVTNRTAGDEPEAFLRSLEEWSGADNTQATGVSPQMLNVARFLTTREQVRRDRDYGFVTGIGRGDDPNGRIGCEKRITQDDGTNQLWPGLDNLCSDNPRYPILYSIFPGDTNHNGDTASTSAEKNLDTHFENQPSRGFDPTLPLPDQTAVTIDDNYLLALNNTFGTPQGAITEGVNDFVRYTAFSDEDIEKIALNPLPMRNWVLPHKGGASPNNTPNSATDVLIQCDTTSVNCDGEFVKVAFKDAALMDGRQLMNVRVMDLNMDLLSDTTVTVSPNGGQRDTWLPSGNSALVYLFREDAVREDAIVRPFDPTRNIDCINDIEIRKPECWLQAGDRSVFDSTDPRLIDIDPNPDITGDEYKASIKPVDYWADPDRRPYGFRLRNGEDLSRLRDANINESISVISDQPVYLLRDFNLHKAYGGADLQEFKGAGNLLDFNNFTFDKFYERGEALGTADERFAASNGDQWRQTEVFSDAVTILSNNFCDGSIEDLFTYSKNRGQLNGLKASYGCVDDNGYTSYTNFTRLEGALNQLVRENSDTNGDPFDLGAPIAITEAGNPLVLNGGVPVPYNQKYRTKGNDAGREGYIINATDTTANASIYSAIVPSRTKQSYGGLHNFPRFLEDWKDNEAALNITGAFFQLGFSTSATAPYDQPSKTWEPEAKSVTNLPERVEHEYYDPPERRWGYDVALQKNPPGKVASRFIEQTPIVSEFYTEPEVIDPYISQLCQAVNREADIQAICP